MVFSIGQDFDLARKYFCLACEIDDTNLRALWGLFWCNQQLCKKDQGSDKMLQLQTMCVQRLRNAYKPLKHVASTKIMLELLDSELLATTSSSASATGGGQAGSQPGSGTATPSGGGAVELTGIAAGGKKNKK